MRSQFGAAQSKQMLFPITLVPYEKVRRWTLFDADRGIGSARKVREYFIPDFSTWREGDSYQRAFQRLIEDLKQQTALGFALPITTGPSSFGFAQPRLPRAQDISSSYP